MWSKSEAWGCFLKQNGMLLEAKYIYPRSKMSQANGIIHEAFLWSIPEAGMVFKLTIRGIILEAKYAKQNSSRGMFLEAKWNHSRSKMKSFTKQNIGSKMKVFTKHFPRSIPEAKIMLPELFKKQKRSKISGRGPRKKYSRSKMELFKKSIHFEEIQKHFLPPPCVNIGKVI